MIREVLEKEEGRDTGTVYDKYKSKEYISAYLSISKLFPYIKMFGLCMCYKTFFPHELFLEMKGIGFIHRFAPSISDIKRLLSGCGERMDTVRGWKKIAWMLMSRNKVDVPENVFLEH